MLTLVFKGLNILLNLFILLLVTVPALVSTITTSDESCEPATAATEWNANLEKDHSDNANGSTSTPISFFLKAAVLQTISIAILAVRTVFLPVWMLLIANLIVFICVH